MMVFLPLLVVTATDASDGVMQALSSASSFSLMAFMAKSSASLPWTLTSANACEAG
jgi:hypothetical protein